MPVAIITSDKDNVCPLDQAAWIFRKMKTIDKKIHVVRSMSHERFVTTSDEAYIGDIKKSLLVGTQFGDEAVHIDEMFDQMLNN